MAKLTPKQEKFCQRYIETVNRNAKALLDNNKITTRLDELRLAHQERHNTTIDDMVAKYDEAYELAKQNSNPSAITHK